MRHIAIKGLPEGSTADIDGDTLSLFVPHLDWDIPKAVYEASRQGFGVLNIYRTVLGQQALIYSVPIPDVFTAVAPRLLCQFDIVTLAHSAAIASETWSLVNHETHRGVFTINSGVYTGIHAADWQGKDMADYWDTPKLRSYCEALDRHRFMAQHEWTAYRMSEGREQIRIVGNIELVTYQGTLHRLVQTLECQAA
jgi:hypothetical protein